MNADPSGRSCRSSGQAVEHRSPDERAAFLDEACAGDADLRAQVEALLRAARGGAATSCKATRCRRPGRHRR